MTPNPSAAGTCDALFGRPCKSPWRDFKRQSQYVAAYLKAQATGVKAKYEIPAD